MKTQEEIRNFIQLRAEGLSFEKIAKKLKIAKRTLTYWSKKYSLEIANLRVERLEALREEYCLSVEAKVRMWGQIANRIIDEIANRQFRGISADKLIGMLVKVQTKLEQSYIEPVFESENEIDKQKQPHRPVNRP